MLESKPEQASIVDLATPIPEFEPLRHAARFAHGARINLSDEVVTIHWEKLGKSRDWAKVDGGIAATVTLAAASDRRSIVMTCSVENHSDVAIRQVLFPDFAGLLPCAGTADTTFRCCAFGLQPFVRLAQTEASRVWHYVHPTAAGSVEYTSGGLHLSDMIVRWIDFGGLDGGLSLFPRRWGWEPEVPVMLQHSEVEQKLRLVYLHAATIPPGGQWQSGEFWLTPHAGGWAKGIGPYRDFAASHFEREWPLPRHVREGRCTLPPPGQEFLPRFRERDFLMHFVEKPGTSLEAMRRITERASRELRAIPGVRNFGSRIGRAEVADEVVSPNFTELWISIEPDVDYDSTVARVQEAVDGYAGLQRDLLTYLRERIKEVLTGASASPVVRPSGPDTAELRQAAGEWRDALSGIAGGAELKVEPRATYAARWQRCCAAARWARSSPAIERRMWSCSARRRCAPIRWRCAICCSRRRAAGASGCATWRASKSRRCRT